VDPRLLRAYNEELTYLRETAREFGEENETVAARLGLMTPADTDPYVERLLEGVAFLGARVKLKLQDQFPDFTQHLLHAIQPHYLSPTPSICVAALEPQEGDPAVLEGFKVARGAELNAVARDHGGAIVTFKTAQAITLWPLRITEAEYLPSRAAVAGYAAAANVAGGVPLSAIKTKMLPIYLAGSEAIPGELYRQLCGDAVAVVGRSTASAAGAEGWVRLPNPTQYGFDDDCALLPTEGRSFRGYRILTEYFACPERYLFAALHDLERVFAGCKDTCDVVILFNRQSPVLAGAVTASNLKLFATPAINLFEKQLGRVPITPYAHEFHVVPDRTRPLDFEVFRLLEVTAHNRTNAEARPVAPLYAFGALLYDWREALFYVPRLTRRRLSTKEQRLRRRSDYLGTETWISLTSPGDASRIDDVHELSVRALVTNRELPELLRFGGGGELTLSGAPVRAVSVVRAPTRPLPPLGLGEGAWRVIGHLTPNYASLVQDPDGDPALLRDHLALYGRPDDPTMRRQIDGILSVRSKPVTRRVPGQERLAFARGLFTRLRLDDASFENGRVFLFAAVVERFLAEFAAVNTFIECEFETPQEGIFARWPPRMGERRNI
jgi:type VI secretion system protein ImpG